MPLLAESFLLFSLLNSYCAVHAIQKCNNSKGFPTPEIEKRLKKLRDIWPKETGLEFELNFI